MTEPFDLKEKVRNISVDPLGEHATTCIAHFILHLALLRIVARASHYASSRLARHKMKCTLKAAQLRILG
jgi:hypothetical protein